MAKETTAVPTGGTGAGNGNVTLPIFSAGQSVRVMRRCVEEPQVLTQKHGEPGHVAACWIAE